MDSAIPSCKGFGSRLRSSRLGMGLSQIELGVSSGVLVPSISRYENGLCYPSFVSLVSLSIVLDVSIDWLCFGSSSREFD